MKTFVHLYDLPDHVVFNGSVAVDTEAMGLKNYRDRLCVVQLSAGDGTCHLVHFPEKDFSRSHNLVALLTNKNIRKIFHYARFDVAILNHSFDIMVNTIYCTKIASRLVRTFTDKHGLKDLCKDLLGVEISKQEQTSDWGKPILTQDQVLYAARDVLHLHKLKEKLDDLLNREQRTHVADACFQFLPYRAWFDLKAGEAHDIFSYKCD